MSSWPIQSMPQTWQDGGMRAGANTLNIVGTLGEQNRDILFLDISHKNTHMALCRYDVL